MKNRKYELKAHTWAKKKKKMLISVDKVNISILNFVCPQTFLSVSWVRLSGEARHGFSSQMPASRCKTNELISNGYTCWKRKVNDPRKFTETVLWCSRLKPKMEKHNAINQKVSNREIGLIRKRRKTKKKKTEEHPALRSNSGNAGSH